MQGEFSLREGLRLTVSEFGHFVVETETGFLLEKLGPRELEGCFVAREPWSACRSSNWSFARVGCCWGAVARRGVQAP